MRKSSLASIGLPIAVLILACGGTGSAPEATAIQRPASPSAGANNLTYFEGTADLVRREIHVVYRAPNGDIQLEATLPTGPGANQITLHTVSTSWSSGTNVLTGQVSAINHYAGTVTGLTAKIDSIAPTSVTSDAPWVYGTVAAGATAGPLAWNFSDPTATNFHFNGHVEGNAPGAQPCGQSGQKCAFVTSGTTAGGFGGAAGASTICQNAADAQGLGGTFKAWVSDPSGSPSTSFTHPSVPYRLLDGSTVASSYASLASGTLSHAIDLTELGVPAGGTTSVWTNTTASGTSSASSTCTNWTSNTSRRDEPLLASSPAGAFSGEVHARMMRMLMPEQIAARGDQPWKSAVTAHLNYYGGPVLPNAKVYAVFWGNAVNATTKSQIGSFFGAVTQSSYFDWLSEYDTNIVPTGGGTGTSQTVGRGTFAGNITIAPSNTATTIDDAQIQTELTMQIAAGHLPAPDANALYMIYFPPGVTITQAGSTSCQQFCAYHSTIARSPTNVRYGVMPDMAPPSACSFGCGTASTVFDNLTTVSSHEMIEATTDADVGLASSFAPPLAWYDPTGSNGEIGDICNGAQASVTSGGRVWTVQQQWSNVENACIVARADFSLSASPTPQTVNAGSTVSYTVSAPVTTGNAQTVAFSVSGLPTGVSGSFSPSSVTSGGTSTLTLTALGSAATSGPTTFTITGTGSFTTHTATAVVSVQGAVSANDFSIALAPPSSAVNDGSTTTYTVTTAVTSGSAQTIALSASGLPAGVSGSFSPTSVTAGSSSTLTLTATSSAAAATATFTVTGTATSGAHGATASVTVSGPQMGATGVDTTTGAAWTQSTTQQCSAQAHLYCFEQ